MTVYSIVLSFNANLVILSHVVCHYHFGFLPFRLKSQQSTTADTSISKSEHVADTSFLQISPLIEMLSVPLREVINLYSKNTAEFIKEGLNDNN